jgi:DNA-binding NarL/FixJ family response regulator
MILHIAPARRSASLGAIAGDDVITPPDTDPQPAIRILVAEHQPIVRHGLVTILALEPDMSVVAEAANAEEALHLARLCRPDAVLIDVQMPRLGGCATIQQILVECPDTHVLVLTTVDTDEMLVLEAISSGADAYLLNASEHEIVYAIRAVMRQESCLSPRVTRTLLNEFRRIRPVADKLPHEPLTIREARILNLVIEGRCNKEIATTICLAEGTVKNYVSRIMEKLNVRTRTELAVKGLRHPIRIHRAGAPITASQRERPS